MYVKRIQISNYGPIDQLDVTLPFDEEKPKPVLLIGENGSGKSIVLSHLVNGLISAKDRIYPHSTEVEANQVYKLRSNSYIKLEKEVYFARVDYEENLHAGEIRSRLNREEYEEFPLDLSSDQVQEAWMEMPARSGDHYFGNISSSDEAVLRQIIARNCLLYFPPNRFEQPAWLNEENLNAHANYMELKRIHGYSERMLVNHSSLHENQNWLFDLGYDSRVLEIKLQDIDIPVGENQSIPFTRFIGYRGEASRSYDVALQVLRNIFDLGPDTRFGIGPRRNRVVSILSEEQVIVPNIFQLSTGETSLLNLFLSILRDFELSGSSFNSTQDIRGIVVVDEIDLHLHVSHQYSILPNLIKMFPKVQFIATTHSPLFILGMRNVFGDGGFALYRMPGGEEIDPENFSEFESAYESFAHTNRFTKDLQFALKEAAKPIVLVEGKTDIDYINKASQVIRPPAHSWRR